MKIFLSQTTTRILFITGRPPATLNFQIILFLDRLPILLERDGLKRIPSLTALLLINWHGIIIINIKKEKKGKRKRKERIGEQK